MKKCNFCGTKLTICFHRDFKVFCDEDCANAYDATRHQHEPRFFEGPFDEHPQAALEGAWLGGGTE